MFASQPIENIAAESTSALSTVIPIKQKKTYKTGVKVITHPPTITFNLPLNLQITKNQKYNPRTFKKLARHGRFMMFCGKDAQLQRHHWRTTIASTSSKNCNCVNAIVKLQLRWRHPKNAIASRSVIENWNEKKEKYDEKYKQVSLNNT